MKSRAFFNRKYSGGVSLPVVLMFLLVVTVLGTMGIRRATVSEALSRNQLDYEVARQAAEAALRDGQRDLQLVNGNVMPGAVCARGADRPLTSATSAPYFDLDCPRGQCRQEVAYYETSSYASTPPVNPQPWWPDDNTASTKGGLWDGVAGAGASAKPLGPATAGNCPTFKGAVPLGTFTGTPKIASVARQPEYLYEFLKRADERLIRITARGYGTDIATEVVLQAYFRPYQ